MEQPITQVQGHLYEIEGFPEFVNELLLDREILGDGISGIVSSTFSQELGDYIEHVVYECKNDWDSEFAIYYDRILDMLSAYAEVISMLQNETILVTRVSQKGHLLIITGYKPFSEGDF